MIKYLSIKIANYIANISNTPISKDDIDILRYGLESIINTTITVTIIIFFSFIKKCISLGMLWIFSFLTFRKYINGFHAKSHFSCIVYSSILGITSQLICVYLFRHHPFVRIIFMVTIAFIETIILYLLELILQNTTYSV